jgi:hypothetical protein
VSETPIVTAPGGIRTIMGQAIALYRARFLLYLALIAIPVVPVGIAMVIIAAAAPNPGGATNTLTGLDLAAQFLLVMPLAQAMVAYAASAQLTGRKVTLVEVLRAVLPWFGVLVGTVLLSVLVMALVLVAMLIPGLAVAVAVEPVGRALIILGLIAFVVPGFMMAIWFQFVGPVVILERVAFVTALRRCRDVVRGSWWRTFRYILVIEIVGAIASLLVAAVFGGVAIPSDASDRARLVLPLTADIPASVLVLPFSTIALTIVYLRLRRLRPPA